MTIYGTSQTVLLSQGNQVGLARWLVQSPAKPLPESIINRPKMGFSLRWHSGCPKRPTSAPGQICTYWLRRVRLAKIVVERMME